MVQDSEFKNGPLSPQDVAKSPQKAEHPLLWRLPPPQQQEAPLRECPLESLCNLTCNCQSASLWDTDSGSVRCLWPGQLKAYLLLWNSRMQGPISDLDQILHAPKKHDHAASRLWRTRRAKDLIWASRDGRRKQEIRHQRSNLSINYGPFCAARSWKRQNPPGGANSAALSVTVMEDLCHTGAPSASPGVTCCPMFSTWWVKCKEQTCSPSGHSPGPPRGLIESNVFNMLYSNFD